MYQFLNLCEAGNLAERGIVECRSDSGRVGTFDGSGNAGKCCGYFIAEEKSESAKMTMIFRFDAYLNVLVLIEYTLSRVGQPFEPLREGNISSFL